MTIVHGYQAIQEREDLKVKGSSILKLIYVYSELSFSFCGCHMQ